MKGAIENLSPKLLAVLSSVEDLVGFELTITSGYRDLVHNAKVGGVSNSEHRHNPSDGADALAHQSGMRFKIVKAALSLGVTRIGIGKTFVHLGVATDLPQEVMWHYYQEEKKRSAASAVKDV